MAQQRSGDLPLTGIRVIDVATVIAAPYYASIRAHVTPRCLRWSIPWGVMPAGTSVPPPAAATR
jgi:hypothetical protein